MDFKLNKITLCIIMALSLSACDDEDNNVPQNNNSNNQQIVQPQQPNNNSQSQNNDANNTNEDNSNTGNDSQNNDTTTSAPDRRQEILDIIDNIRTIPNERRNDGEQATPPSNNTQNENNSTNNDTSSNNTTTNEDLLNNPRVINNERREDLVYSYKYNITPSFEKPLSTINYSTKRNDLSIAKKDGITKDEDYNTKYFRIASELQEHEDISKQDLQELKKWDRLERDVHLMKNGNQPTTISQLGDFATDELSKVLVLDVATNENSRKTYDTSKVTNVYVYETEPPSTVKTTNSKKIDSSDTKLKHADYVLHTILGEELERAKEEEVTSVMGNQIISPLHKNGKVYLVTSAKGWDQVIDINSLLSPVYTTPAFQQGYNIVNMSMAYTMTKDNFPNLTIRSGESILDAFVREGYFDNSSFSMLSGRMYNAVKYNDALFVVAGGNEADKGVNGMAVYPFIPRWTTGRNAMQGKVIRDGFIVVGSFDKEKDQEGKLSSWSNSCGVAKENCLVAQGTLVFEPTRNTFTSVNGTSMSAPRVSAAAAMVKSLYPFMTNYNIQQTILTTATDLGDPGIDDMYGWGLLNEFKAANGPAKFYKKDFVVDFSHNESNLRAGYNRDGVFRFSNDINGDYGLTVKGGKFSTNVLSLSGYNTYKGNTTIENRGILNIDGVNLNSNIYVKEGGSLYGSGYLNHVRNEGGDVYANSYFFNTDPTSKRTAYGMNVQTYYQNATGTLNVVLGRPLVAEKIQLEGGTLNVVGVKDVYKKADNRIFRNVAIADSIEGKFDTLKISTPLLSLANVNYLTYQKDGEQFDAVEVEATYNEITSLSGVTEASNKNELLEGAKFIDHVFAQLNDIDSYEEEVSGLYELYGKFQGATNIDDVKDIAKAFSGYDVDKNVKEQSLSTDYNKFNLLNNEKSGIYYNTAENQKYININHEGFKFQVGHSSKDIETVFGKNKYKTRSVYLGQNVKFGNFDVSAYLGYSKGENEYKYQKSFVDNVYSFNQKFDNEEFSFMTTFGYGFNFDKHFVKPYGGLDIAYQRMDDIKESYDDVLFEIKKDNKYQVNGILGLQYKYQLSRHFGLNLNYSLIKPFIKDKYVFTLGDDLQVHAKEVEYNSKLNQMAEAGVSFSPFTKLDFNITGFISKKHETNKGVKFGIEYKF